MRILSLDQLLEEALTSLYRMWYTLPRRSTLPQLERLRGQLADKLAALPHPIDLTTCEQAMIDFAAAVRALPGAADAGGAVLADLAQAVPTAQRREFGITLRKTDVSPQRIGALVALLRLSNPPQAVIAGLSYAPDQARTVWRAVWDALAPRLDQLPEQDRARILDIRRQYDAAAGAAAGARQRQETYVAGLQALEQVPAVIRIAWPIFLANKYVGEAPTFLHAAIDDTQLEQLAQALPDMPLTAGAEPPPGPPIGTDAQSRREEPGPAIAFFTNVRFPAQVKRDEVQWLSVQLTLEAAAESVVQETVPVAFAPTPQGEQPPPEYVEVRLVAPDFREETGVWERTMLVYPKRDSQPVVFLLRPDKAGPKRLAIDFLHKGRMIANIAFKCEVVEGTTLRSATAVELEEKPEFGTMVAHPPPPADLELRVTRTAEANGLAFVLNSTHPDLPLRVQPVGQVMLTEKDPQDFFTSRLQRLSDLAAAIPGGATDPRVVQEIESLGEGLFELLVPAELQALYWEQIKPLVDAGKIKSLLITSDEPWIPWELIKPYRWNENDDTEQTSAFLVEQFTLSRWLTRPLPPPITVRTAALVMPTLNLLNVQRERDFFTTLAQQHNLQVEGPLDERSEVIASLRAGEFQLLHFATHGGFDQENADRSELSLADGALTPADLMGSDLRGLRKARPLVFLNACHSGQVALGLVGLGGWAEKFFHEARAAAFVGTLWEVNDDLAAEFTRVFYTALADGKTLGEALRAARLQLRDQDSANPTWLAYSLYGDPNGRVTFG